MYTGVDEVVEDDESFVGGKLESSRSSSLLEIKVGSVGTVVEATGVASSKASAKSSGTSLPACSCKSFSSSSNSFSRCCCLSRSSLSLSFFSLSCVSFAVRTCSSSRNISFSRLWCSCFCSHLNASIWFIPYTLREDTGQ